MTDETVDQGAAAPDGDTGVDFEAQARELGWRPREEFRGDPSQFIDAKEFVERGKNVMPLLRANNRKLTEELAVTRNELAQVRQMFQASQEAIQELKTFNTQFARDRAQEQQVRLTEQIREARQEGNVELEVQLTNQLGDVNHALRTAQQEAAASKRDTPPPPDQTVQPWLQQWLGENPWYQQNPERAAVMNGLAQSMRADPRYAHLKERDFLNTVKGRLDQMMGGTPTRAKVEGGNGNGAGSRFSGGKSYNDLPPDAKAACDRQGQRLVGEGRAFKNDQEWRAHYVSKYFTGE